MDEWGKLNKVLWVLKQSRTALYKNQVIYFLPHVNLEVPIVVLLPLSKDP